MAITTNFTEYQEEMALIRAQNRVECDLYSIIAQMIREGDVGKQISLRDVSTRRSSDFSNVFKGQAGFPDFVIRKRELTNHKNNILGAVEVKKLGMDLDEHQKQLQGHVASYKKVLFTNGLEWRFYKGTYRPLWTCRIGAIVKDGFTWDVLKWEELLLHLKAIDWHE